jgi:hypothetical protein
LPWFDHPAYRPVRNELLDRFRSREVAFHSLKHVVFLCGGSNSQPRRFLLEYLNRWATDTLVFQADDVWARIASFGTQNALAMEAYLAELADAVVIIVESPGTFAELGAFSNNELLRKKLLPILDVQFRGVPSFINTGPVRWTDVDSIFRPTLFVRLDSILSEADQVIERLSRLPRPSTQRIDNLSGYPKHLMFFLRDIVAVIGPVTVRHVERYVEAILGSPAAHVLNLLGLAESIGLLETGDTDNERYYFVRMTEEFRPVVRKRFFELPNERAKVLAALQTIEVARGALRLLSR